MKVLVKEKIGESGVQLLRDAGLEVELGVDWEDGELERRIGDFEGILYGGTVARVSRGVFSWERLAPARLVVVSGGQ